MKKETDLTAGISQHEVVGKFIADLKHPMIDIIKYLRSFPIEAFITESNFTFSSDCQGK